MVLHVSRALLLLLTLYTLSYSTPEIFVVCWEMKICFSCVPSVRSTYDDHRWPKKNRLGRITWMQDREEMPKTTSPMTLRKKIEKKRWGTQRSNLSLAHTHTTRNIHLPNRIGIIKIFWIYFFFFLNCFAWCIQYKREQELATKASMHIPFRLNPNGKIQKIYAYSAFEWF